MRAFSSQPSEKRSFFKTIFDFLKMDILKMSKIENQFTFWNSSCQDTKNSEKIIQNLLREMVTNYKNSKNSILRNQKMPII